MSTSLSDPQVQTAPPVRSSSSRSRRNLLLAILVVAPIGVFVAWRISTASRAADDAARAAAASVGARTVPVLVATAERKDVPIVLEGLGSVSAYYTVTVKTQVDGRLDRVLFMEGQGVHAGQVIAQIDPRPFAIQLSQANAALARDDASFANSERTLKRYQSLLAGNLASQQNVDDAQALRDQTAANVQTDRALIASATLSLDYARVTSPIDGIAGVRLVDPGNVVHVADPTGLVVITQMEPIAVLFTLPEDDLPSVQQAMARGKPLVEAMRRDGAIKLAEGTLEAIDNQINQTTATVRLKAIFPNTDHALFPNQFVKARLRVDLRTDAIVVPAAVVQRGAQGAFAYVADDKDTVAVRPVVVSAIQGDEAIVTGLQPKERVVVDGQNQLRPGTKISVRPGTSANPVPTSTPRRAAPP